MNRKLLFIPLILFLLLVAAFMVQLTRNAGGEDPTMLESALIGKPVPAFKLESLDQPGKTYDQAVLRNGKPMLLNVWATWCPTCRAEHQYLNTLATRGIRVVGLNYKDDRSKAVTWLNSLGNPYALSLYDGDGMLGLDLGGVRCTGNVLDRRTRHYSLSPRWGYERTRVAAGSITTVQKVRG